MKKKLLCLALALCLVFAFAACGGGNVEQADLEGTWSADVDVSDEIASGFSQDELTEAFGADVSAYIDVNDLTVPPITVVMTLNADGTFTMAADDSCKQIVGDAVIDWFKNSDFEGLFTAVLEEQCKEAGITMDEVMDEMGVETIGELIEAMMGMTLDEYLDSLSEEMTEGMDEIDLSEFSKSGEWTFDGDSVTLTADGETDILALDKSALTLTESADGVEAVFAKN